MPDREIAFLPESDQLEQPSVPTVERIGQTLLSNPGMKSLSIDVYAESGESPAAALHLASRRAQVLKRVLAGKGVPETKVESKGLLPYKTAIIQDDLPSDAKRIVRVSFLPTEAP